MPPSWPAPAHRAARRSLAGSAADRIEDRNLPPIGERCRQPTLVAKVFLRVRRDGGLGALDQGMPPLGSAQFERAIAVNALARLDGTLRALLPETYRLGMTRTVCTLGSHRRLQRQP